MSTLDQVRSFPEFLRNNAAGLGDQNTSRLLRTAAAKIEDLQNQLVQRRRGMQSNHHPSTLAGGIYQHPRADFD